MGAGIHIRDARPGDAAELHRLLVAMAHDMGKAGEIAGSAADLARFGFGPDARFTAMLAGRDDEPAIGFLLYFPEYSSWRGRPGLYVQDLYVAAEARGSGLAQALIGEAARRCAAVGGCYLRLSVHAGNVAAERFYHRLGFDTAADETVFVLEGPAFERAAADANNQESR